MMICDCIKSSKLVTIMRKGHFTTTLFTLTLGLLLIGLFATSTFAIKEAAITELKGGKQIWIKAIPTDRREVMLRGDEGAAKEIFAKAPPSILGGPEAMLVSLEGGGFAEYDFEWAKEEDAWINQRVFDFRGGGQSTFVVLNSQDHEVDGMILDTPGPWAWAGGREGDLSFTKFLKGANILRIVPREAAPGKEPAVDLTMLSNKEYKANDGDAAGLKFGPLSVDPVGKLATMWSKVKADR